jgi:hypothetical protein
LLRGWLLLHVGVLELPLSRLAAEAVCSKREYTGQYNTILDVGTFVKDVGGRDDGLIGTVGKS